MHTREIIKKIILLPEDPSNDLITSTAKELEMLNFSPLLLIEAPNLVYMIKADILSEIGRIEVMSEENLPDYDRENFSSPDDFKQRHFDLLYFYYELLGRLRTGTPEAWDYVHELYEDD